MANPLRLLTVYRRASRLYDLLAAASLSHERNLMDPKTKSLFASKTFWFNVITAAAELLQVLPVPAGTVAIGAAVVNIALRFVTDQGVHIVARQG